MDRDVRRAGTGEFKQWLCGGTKNSQNQSKHKRGSRHSIMPHALQRIEIYDDRLRCDGHHTNGKLKTRAALILVSAQIIASYQPVWFSSLLQMLLQRIFGPEASMKKIKLTYLGSTMSSDVKCDGRERLALRCR